MALHNELRRFVVDNFLFGKPGEGFADGDSFLELGIIDSTGVMELIAFLEERYAIKMQDHDLIPENLDSINGMARFIESRLPSNYPGERNASRVVLGIECRAIAGKNGSDL
jgi:acyl carrier protein